jgi:hypothetical protein
MSAAEVINYKNVTAKSSVQATEEIETLLSVVTNEQAVEEQANRSSARAANRKFMAESTPYACPPEAPPAPASKETSVEKLFDYLNLLMLFQIKTSKDQSTVVQMNQTLSDGNIALTKAYGTQATDALNKYIQQLDAEQAAAKRQSFWSILMGVATLLLGALTADPVAIGMGVIQLMMQIPLDKDGNTLNTMLDKSISTLSPALQVIVPLVIAIAETVVLCSIQSALDNVSSAAKEGADIAESAATGAGKAGVSDAAKSSAEIEMTEFASTAAGKAVIEEVAETEQTVVTQGSKLVLKDATKKMAQEAGRKLTSAGVALKLPQLLAFIRAIRLPQLLMLLSSGSFWPTLCKQIAERCTNDPVEQDNISTYLTDGVMIASSFGGALLAGSSNGLTNLLKRFENDSMVMATKMLFKGVEAGCGITGGVYAILKGYIEKDEQALLNVQGTARLIMTLTQGLAELLQAVIARVNGSYTQVYDDLSTISKNTDKFIDVYDPRNLMG